jgi:antirestriction protein ArdC
MNTTYTQDGQIALDFTAPVAAPSVAAPEDQTDRERLTRDDRMDAARDVLARGLEGVKADPEALARFLAFRARFHDYSLNNAVLIWTQRPSARHCMGYKSWQANGRQVRKGERGLTVFAPILRRPTKQEVAAGADPAKRIVAGFRTAVTFDYEQTDAVTDDALVYPPPAPRLDADDPAGLGARLEAVAVALGYRVSYTETAYADGSCSFSTRTITVQQALSPADRAAVLCHELAHALTHEGDRETTRAQKELQAEGAAFVALSALGLDTARASLPYLKGWAGDDDALVRELNAIDRIAADLVRLVETIAA